jgi:hypothetical protein
MGWRRGDGAFAPPVTAVECPRTAVATHQARPRAQSDCRDAVPQLHAMTSDLRIAEPDPGCRSRADGAAPPCRRRDDGRQPTAGLGCAPSTFSPRQPPRNRHTDSSPRERPSFPPHHRRAHARLWRALARQVRHLPHATCAGLRDPLRGSRRVGTSSRSGPASPLTGPGSPRITATRPYRHRPAPALSQPTPREAR